MVKLELNVKEIIGLFDSNAIDEKQLKKYITKFDKGELEQYIIGESTSEANDEEDTEDDEEEQDL